MYVHSGLSAALGGCIANTKFTYSQLLRMVNLNCKCLTLLCEVFIGNIKMFFSDQEKKMCISKLHGAMTL